MRVGWKVHRLGDLAIVITKGTTPTSVGFQFLEEGVNFIKIESISKTGTFIENKFAYISEEANLALKRSQLKEGDILFSIAGALGRTAVVTKDILPANTNQALSIIRLKENPDILTKYILSALTTGFAIEQIEKFRGGVAQQNLSLGQMKEFQIPIPTIEEQKEIVEILDQAFESIDKAKANIEKNIDNAKELFQSKLNQIFSQTGEGWEETQLGKIYDVRDGTHDSPKYQQVGYPLITSKNLKNSDINYDKVKFISKLDFDNINKRSKVDIGDILFAMIGTIGNPVVVKEQPDFAIKNVALFKVPIGQSSLFLKYFLDYSTEKMINESKGSTQRFVGLGYLRKYIINVPSLTKQKEIVKTLDIMDNHIQSLLTSYEEELKNLAELKKSILQKAFSGELTNKNKAA